MVSPIDRIKSQLEFVYGLEKGQQTWVLIERLLEEIKTKSPAPKKVHSDYFSEKDAFIITYADHFSQVGEAPLKTLQKFADSHFRNIISGIHLLPFYPSSSDDGFSVIDFWQVDSDLGTWRNIEIIGEKFRLMFDGVINHISQKSEWFQGYLRGEEPFTHYFIEVDPKEDLSKLVRPRALPVLTTFETTHGKTHVWTTFSDDQIDLNYTHPQVLLAIVNLLLYYIERGADVIRLDAIAYLWKEIGTQSIHQPEVHHLVKLFRAIFDYVAPNVILITETNVPHDEYISYFGESIPGTEMYDEAQMVYQFPLAPLTLHTFSTGNAKKITQWAATLQPPSPSTTFFNFIASHDGIGVMPAKGLLTDEEIQVLVDKTLAHGGEVSYKTNQDGSKSVYELNITLYDAINNPKDLQADIHIDRFISSQALMLSLAGVPGIYIHSLFGSHNYHECVQITGRVRSINREKFQLTKLERILADSESLHSKVFSRYLHLLRLRREISAFHPNGAQQIISAHHSLFGILRTSPDSGCHIISIVNVSSSAISIDLELDAWEIPRSPARVDLIEDKILPARNRKLPLSIRPYQVMWLQPADR